MSWGGWGGGRVVARCRCLTRIGAFLVVLLAAAEPAWAASGGSDTWLGIPRVLWYTLNLLLFFGLLGWLLAKPLAAFFRTRQEEIARALAEATRQQEEAARMRVEMERRVTSLEGEIAALRQRLRDDGVRERAALVQQGEQEAQRLLSQLDEEAARRREEAQASLAREAAGIAAELAWELLQREVTPEDRERIFRTTLERLRGQVKGGVQ